MKLSDVALGARRIVLRDRLLNRVGAISATLVLWTVLVWLVSRGALTMCDVGVPGFTWPRCINVILVLSFAALLGPGAAYSWSLAITITDGRFFAKRILGKAYTAPLSEVEITIYPKSRMSNGEIVFRVAGRRYRAFSRFSGYEEFVRLLSAPATQ